jgi:hypothetical protein
MDKGQENNELIIFTTVDRFLFDFKEDYRLAKKAIAKLQEWKIPQLNFDICNFTSYFSDICYRSTA